jgi:hypothetical protein
VRRARTLRWPSLRSRARRDHVGVRTADELIDLPFAFRLRERHLLMPDKFRGAARERGVPLLVDEQLEALHRAGVLVPMLRVSRDGRALAAAARRNPSDAWDFRLWSPTRPEDLRQARSEGRMHDPAVEGFTPWSNFERRAGDARYRTSVYLYAPHQLISLSLVRDVLPHLRWSMSRSIGALTAERPLRERWLADGARDRELAIAASAIEPRYFPSVIGLLKLSGFNDPEEYHLWRNKLRLQSLLRWLGISAAWLTTAAEELLQRVYLIDPLGPWGEVIAQGDPDKWGKLKGEALSAMDLRVTAEVFLRYHDDLVDNRKAKALPESPVRWPSPFDYRLKRRRSLDSLLTDFGLSPHPQLVLVVEGATEGRIFPRVMRHFGVRLEDDFISIQDAGGVDSDLQALFAALAPRLNEARNERYVEFERPPTRFLVVFDPEGKAATREQREDRKRVWVDRIMSTLTHELQTPIVREQMQKFVFVQTWRRNRDSFEFAHFTDRQLAAAIHPLDKRPNRPSLEKLVGIISRLRDKNNNVGKFTDSAKISKLDLADALWPMLRRKFELAERHGTERRVPIVRVLDRACYLANEWPRKNLVIGLERQPRVRRRKT